jgi:hypothetical protein
MLVLVSMTHSSEKQGAELGYALCDSFIMGPESMRHDNSQMGMDDQV